MENLLERPMEPNEVCHHLDGNRQNNRESNLIVMLRGQHTKLRNWLKEGGPGSERFITERGLANKALRQKKCQCCGRPLRTSRARFCSKACLQQTKRENWPSKAQLKKDMDTLNWCAIGRKYNVSDNAVRKWAIAYKLLQQK